MERSYCQLPLAPQGNIRLPSNFLVYSFIKGERAKRASLRYRGRGLGEGRGKWRWTSPSSSQQDEPIILKLSVHMAEHLQYMFF